MVILLYFPCKTAVSDFYTVNFCTIKCSKGQKLLVSSFFQVFYKARDSNSDPLFQDVDGKDTYNVTLGGLRKFVWYNMQILAYTRMGDGVLSSPVSGRTDEDGKF